MTEIYLFDWGDTLMVDLPGVPGKMCDWHIVEAVDGAEETLRFLSRYSEIYVATGAAESTESEIKAAFDLVNLGKYIAGYFCKANLGIEKGCSSFLASILTRLEKQPDQVTMVGDSFKKDIEPALALDIHAVWLTKGRVLQPGDNIRIISSLRELCM